MVQTFFGITPPPFYPGMVTRNQGFEYAHCLNNTQDLSQVNSATITYTANATYTVVVNGESFVHTDPGTGSATTVRDNLVAQINLSAQEIRAEATGADVFTITSVEGASASVSATAGIAIAQVQASALTSDVPLGLAVVSAPDSLDNQAQLGGDVGHKFLGVTVDNQLIQRDQKDIQHTYDHQSIMLILTKGHCAVQVEEDVDPRSTVFYRYSGTGTLGAFRATTDAGADIQLVNARFTTTTPAGGIAELYLGAVA